MVFFFLIVFAVINQEFFAFLYDSIRFELDKLAFCIFGNLHIRGIGMVDVEGEVQGIQSIFGHIIIAPCVLTEEIIQQLPYLLTLHRVFVDPAIPVRPTSTARKPERIYILGDIPYGKNTHAMQFARLDATERFRIQVF